MPKPAPGRPRSRARLATAALALAALAAFAAPANAVVVRLSFSGTYTAPGPVFGVVGSAVPYAYTMVYETGLDTNTLFFVQGSTTPTGTLLADNFHGYDRAGILQSQWVIGNTTFTPANMIPRTLFAGASADLLFDTNIASHPPTATSILFQSSPGSLSLGGTIVSFNELSFDRSRSRIQSFVNAAIGTSVNMVIGWSSNNTCATPEPVTEGEHFFSTVGATTDGLPALICGGGINRDIWYRFVPAQSGPCTVSTCTADFDTRLAVYAGDACANLNAQLLACNDNACGDGSLVSFNAVAGQPYLIRIGDAGVAPGSGTLSITRTSTFGACCNPATGGCLPLTQSDCAAFGGRFLGFDTPCGPAACTPCPGDANRDGAIDLLDLLDFIAAWSASLGQNCP